MKLSKTMKLKKFINLYKNKNIYVLTDVMQEQKISGFTLAFYFVSNFCICLLHYIDRSELPFSLKESFFFIICFEIIKVEFRTIFTT